MFIDSVQTLIDILRHERLLSEKQLHQLTPELLARFDNPRSLAKYLVQMDWLTVYQINHLFEGRGQDLVIDSYQILDRLGEGGVSDVYKAWDTKRNRLVALKVLRQDLPSECAAVKQFKRELEAVTRLSHTNIIKTHDANQIDHTYYFAMEFVEGTDLGKVVQLGARCRFRTPANTSVRWRRDCSTRIKWAWFIAISSRPISFSFIPPNRTLCRQGTPGNAPPTR